MSLARQKPRLGYRRHHAGLDRRGAAVSSQRVYQLYRKECLAVRRLLRKRYLRMSAEPSLLARRSQEWALGFVHDSLTTGRGIRILTIVDCFTREPPARRLGNPAGFSTFPPPDDGGYLSTQNSSSPIPAG